MLVYQILQVTWQSFQVTYGQVVGQDKRYVFVYSGDIKYETPGSILSTWINLNPNMNK